MRKSLVTTGLSRVMENSAKNSTMDFQVVRYAVIAFSTGVSTIILKGPIGDLRCTASPACSQ